MEIFAGKSVVEVEIKALNLLKKSIDSNFKKAVNLLFGVKGKIIISGIGKSGHVGSKISSTLSSIGSPSFFIHPSEANHGDLGMVTKKDCAILISNSGETSELFNLILHCKKLKVPIISITSNQNSTLAKKSDLVLKIPKNIEACPLELAPTSSTTCMLVLGDAIAVTLLKKREFTSQDFHELHPGGKLGQMLLKVSDVMKTKNQIPLISRKNRVDSAILEMSFKGQGCVGIISEKTKELIGIITDGDLRRHMSSSLLSKNVEEVMTKNPKTLSPETLVLDAIKLMNSQSITNYFITSNKKPLGIIHLHDILRN
jgi:arabinose-5-phosphate isomerase